MKFNKETGGKKSSSDEAVTESFISPRLSKKDREETEEVFLEFRRNVKSKRTGEDEIKIQLLQLKYLIEDYLKTDNYNKAFNFGFFLNEYIDRLNKKNKDFAREIDIEPTELSQIIHSRRYPNEKVLMRLELHSNKNFPAIMWFKLLEKERALELIEDDKLRNSERKHVKEKLQFSI